ncbi:MAG: manganese/zinc/iron transport system ATP- binding protein [Nonlabens sp.]
MTFLNVKHIATGPVKDIFNDDNLTKTYGINYKVAVQK